MIASTPEVIEAHHVTGDDCFILKVLARSMTDLERITGRLATLGRITTSVVYSSPVPDDTSSRTYARNPSLNLAVGSGFRNCQQSLRNLEPIGCRLRLIPTNRAST